jgi:DNA-binding MarR family transcriptional regulator
MTRQQRGADVVAAPTAVMWKAAAAAPGAVPAQVGDVGESTARAWSVMQALVLDHDRKTAACEALGLSFVRIKALRTLLKGPTAMSDLAAKLITDKPYTTIIIDDLEQRGLVARSVDPEDRRCKIAALTPDGTAAAERAEAILGEPPPGLRRLSAPDAAELDRILRAVQAAG